jgi:GDP-D-mannose 3',5'-epimerase
MKDERILIAGGGGFIGGHLVADLLGRGSRNLRVVDIQPFGEWHQLFPGLDNQVLDLRDRESCRTAVNGCQVVYNFAADMGGMGFIENNKALCMLSVLINTLLLEAAREIGVRRFFFRLLGLRLRGGQANRPQQPWPEGS